jgi:hypothetical protein
MTLFLYILLGFLIAALELRRRFRGQAVDAMTVFNCYYLVLYAFVPINVIWLGADVVRQQYAYEQFGRGDIYTALSLIVCYALFYFGYWAKSGKGSSFVGRDGEGCFSFRNSAYVAKIIFFFGVVAAVIYVVQIGGISEVLANAADVRSGEYVVESKYIFYRHFAQFSADAFVLFCVVLMGKRVARVKVTGADKVFLLCAFVFFVFYALSTFGRRPFIYPIILCYLVYWSLGGQIRKLSVVVFVLVFIIAGLGTTLAVVGPVGNYSELLKIAYNDPALFKIAYYGATQGLGDSFIHYVASQNATLWQFGFLTDIVNLPRDFFPSQLFGFTRSRNMLGETSEFILGHALPDGVTGEEALGLHGYLLVNFGYVGMFVSFFFLGLFYKWLHIRFRPTERKDAVGWLIYWWVVLGFFVYFREGLLIFVLKEHLTWWSTIALLLHYKAKQWVVPTPSAGMTHLHGSH